MLSIIKIVNTYVAITVLMASCARSAGEETQINKTPAQSQIIATESVSIVSLAQTSVSNTNYLSECKTINPAKLTEQIPYRNILPGKTKESEVESILGMPDKRSVFRDEINLVYGSDVGVLVINNIVTPILVSSKDESKSTLEEAILKYGCPDIVLAVNTTEDQVGYNSIRLIYSMLGLTVSFAHYPANLGDSLDKIWYFPSMTIQEYFEKNSWAEVSSSAKPVEWNDAVK